MSGPLLGALALVISSGCSDNTSGPRAAGGFTGLVSCDGGSPAVSTECALSIRLMGGISGTFGNFSACGSSIVSLSWSDLGGSDVGIGVTFMGAAFPVDQLGTFPLQALDVTQFTDGGALRWRAPPGGCSIAIQGSICSPTAVFMNRRVLSGTGTCSQPAAPQAGNSEAPITVGDFTFVGFINPM